mmetsp:Transcript_14359/g.40628  ORF Transcript_14359/g.40628 Transcript_14359/m.40628 type:complete len:239 (-) Transcript_14359:90-806(-)
MYSTYIAVNEWSTSIGPADVVLFSAIARKSPSGIETCAGRTTTRSGSLSLRFTCRGGSREFRAAAHSSLGSVHSNWPSPVRPSRMPSFAPTSTFARDESRSLFGSVSYPSSHFSAAPRIMTGWDRSAKPWSSLPPSSSRAAMAAQPPPSCRNRFWRMDSARPWRSSSEPSSFLKKWPAAFTAESTSSAEGGRREEPSRWAGMGSHCLAARSPGSSCAPSPETWPPCTACAAVAGGRMH